MNLTRKKILFKLPCFILAFLFCLRNLYFGATLHQVHTEEESQSEIEALSLSYYSEALSRLLSSKEEHVDKLRFLPNRNIAFLHIGKTGGSSIHNSFRAACNWMGLKSAKDECLNSVNQIESRLSKLTTSYWHCDPRRNNVKQIRSKETTSFLFPIRQPVNRIVSAFYFTHTENSQSYPIRKNFNKCFPSIDSLAKSLPIYYSKNITSTTKDENNATITNTKDVRNLDPKCIEQLLYVLRGYDGINKDKDTLTTYKRGFNHLVWNYKYYMSNSIEKYPSREVFTVRTEFLWDDMKHLDILLNGTGEFYQDGLVHSHGSEKYKARSDLSVEGHRNLCCFMYKELEAYQHLLLLSRNLDRGKTYQSLLDLYQDCGVEGSSDEDLIHHDGESFFVIDWRKWREDACKKYEYEDDFLNYFVDYMYPS